MDSAEVLSEERLLEQTIVTSVRSTEPRNLDLI